MKSVLRLAAALTAALQIVHAGETDPLSVEARRDGWLYVNGERFFVKGTCFFENHSVDGVFERSSLEVIDRELARIKEAGFNTIRSQLRPEELELARKHGLMVWQGANHLCFSSEYRDPNVVEEYVKQTRQVSDYSRNHDNILFMGIDNEPVVMEGIYHQGEATYRAFLGKLAGEVEAAMPDRPVSMANFPPSGFLDQTRFGVACVNLYPWYPSQAPNGYGDYLAWYKKRHASQKPLLVSEYGWAVGQGEDRLERMMPLLLDEQTRAGASGSFFFTWRAFGEEGTHDHGWFGVIPNKGRRGDHENPPRPLFDTFKRYFEAVIIEPTKYGAYRGHIPVEVYGTDKTHSMTVDVGSKPVSLKRNGRYWWVGRVPLKKRDVGQRTVTVTARDSEGRVLTEKTVDVLLNRTKEQLVFTIEGPTGPLSAGQTYEAVVRLKDGQGNPIANRAIPLLVNQTGRELFMGEPLSGTTDENGEFRFSYDDAVPGYFTLMAGLGMTDVYHDARVAIDIVRVEE